MGVVLGEPALRDRTLVIPITRDEPQIGTCDMAHYCFAFIVDRTAVDSVEVVVTGRDPISLQLAP